MISTIGPANNRKPGTLISTGVANILAGCVENGTSRFVFVLKPDSTVEQRTVTLGRTEGDLVAVTAGLAAGETVVTEGLDKLQDGSQVVARTVPAPGPAPAAAPAAHAKGAGKGHWNGKNDDAKKP